MKRMLTVMLMALWAMSAPGQESKTAWVYFGTYTGKESKGIYRSEIDLATGKLSKPELAAEIASPSFLAINAPGDKLFCVCEISDFKGKKAGGVASFTLDRKTGALKQINQESSVGTGPCHLTVSGDGACVLVANYGGGSTAALPVNEKGELKEASSFFQHRGSSANKSRQEAPHAHSVNIDKNGKFAVVADLGLDQLLVYKLDSKTGKLTANEPAFIKLKEGSGPRHFAFHPTKPYAYTNLELSSEVTALTYDAEKGTFKALNTLSTLPEPTKGNSTAETVVHPNGKFVYVSNRGHNSIAIFEVNQDTGELKALGHQGKGINIPRNFNIDPTGKWMIVCNQAGNSAIVFEIDASTGKLTPTDQKVEVGAPVCVKFLTK